MRILIWYHDEDGHHDRPGLDDVENDGGSGDEVNKENADVMESAQLCILLSKDCAAMFVQWEKWKVICVLAKNVCKTCLHQFCTKVWREWSQKAIGRFSPLAQNYSQAEPGPRKTEKMQFMDIYTGHFCLSWQFKCWWWRCIEMKVKKLWQKDEMKNSPDRLDWTWQ